MPLLQVENLSKTFDDPAKLFGFEQFYAVKDVSFTLNRKETLAIMGAKRLGKSTLVKMIAGITFFLHQGKSYLMVYHYNLKIFTIVHSIFEWFSKMRIQRLTRV